MSNALLHHACLIVFSTVLEAASAATSSGNVVKLPKSVWFPRCPIVTFVSSLSFEYLGFIVRPTGISPDPDKMKDTVGMPASDDICTLSHFRYVQLPIRHFASDLHTC